MCPDTWRPGPECRLLRLTFRRLAGHSAHVRRHGDFQDLEGLGGGGLVVAQAPGDVEGLAALYAELLAVLEPEIDPALEDVDELPVADVVVPARGLGHALGGAHDLR